ncbi:MAG: hypothetical protein C5B54_07220 [Acidobacteria bacterium]|nr:MAG: hypothetical protein C5B54_07220 [Acidobacteriota bacterium]
MTVSKNHFWFSVPFLLLFFAHAVSAAELGINIHGVSYHPNHSGNELNDWNPGIGVHYLFYVHGRNSLAAEGGIFENSSKDPAGYAALTYRFRVWYGLQLGIGFTFLKSSSVNHGSAVVVPLPVIGYRYHSVSIQMLYAPRVRDKNRNSVYSVYGTYYFYRW